MTDVTNTAFQSPTDRGDGKLEFGAVWNNTYGTFRKAPWTFIGLGLLPLPVSVLAALPKLALGRGNQAAVALGIVFIVTKYFVQFVSQNAMIYGAARQLAGTSFTMGESLAAGFRRVLPMLGVGILLGLAILLGMLLLVIPGLIAAAAFFVSTPVCVVEGYGPIESMKRSAALTKGNRWRVFGAMFTVLLLPIIGIFFFFGIIGLIAVSLHSQIVVVIAFILGALVFVPLVLCLPALGMILLTVVFVELRRLKEGGGSTEAVTRVFD